MNGILMLQGKLYIFLTFILVNAAKISIIPMILDIGISRLQIFYYFITSLIFDLIVFSLTLKIRKPYLFVAAYSLQTVYFLVNIYCFIYFDTVIRFRYVNSLFWESLTAVKNMYIPFNSSTLLPFADLPLALYILVTYRKAQEGIASLRHFRAVLLGSVALLAALFAGIYVTTPPLQEIGNAVLYERSVIARYGMLTHNLLDFLLPAATAQQIDQVRYAPTTVTHTKGGGSRKNIVMVQFESLDGNIIDFRHHGRYVAPFLHELSHRSIYYPYTLCYRRAGGTSDCEIAALNSVEPLENTPFMKSDSYRYPNSLVKHLNGAGYRCTAFHGNYGAFYNRSHAYPQMGFQEFYDLVKMGLQQKGWGASDEDLFEYSLGKLRGESGPFFSYLITMSSHEPFQNVDNYYTNNAYADIESPLVRSYFRSISYADAQLKRFIAGIEKNSSGSFIFIYGDHTPFVINGSNYRRSSVRTAGGEMEFVPLFILTPDHQVHRETRQVASYLDLAPTVLTAADIDFQIQSSGVNLLRPVPAESKLPYFGNLYSRGALFNLASATQGEP